MALDTTTMNKAQLQAAVKALEAAQPKPREVTVKISPATGTIVVSGLQGRYPISLYRSSWKRLLTEETAGKILSFILENDEEISKVMAENDKVDR